MKDESLVRLTNQLHETELSNIMLAATVTNLSNQNPVGVVQVSSATHGQLPSTPSGLPPKHPGLVRLHSNSNGISFDSDKGEFKEFVDVGSQTNEGKSFLPVHWFEYWKKNIILIRIFFFSRDLKSFFKDYITINFVNADFLKVFFEPHFMWSFSTRMHEKIHFQTYLKSIRIYRILKTDWERRSY